MKLQTKDWSPYLPYGLPVQCTILTGDDLGASKRKVLDTLSLDLIFEINSAKKYPGKPIEFKPILRPLSDLNNVGVEGLTYSEWLIEKYYTLDFENQINRIEEDIRWINHCDYLFVNHLIEWHFDVFGLIEKNLATDINTL